MGLDEKDRRVDKYDKTTAPLRLARAVRIRNEVWTEMFPDYNSQEHDRRSDGGQKQMQRGMDSSGGNCSPSRYLQYSYHNRSDQVLINMYDVCTSPNSSNWSPVLFTVDDILDDILANQTPKTGTETLPHYSLIVDAEDRKPCIMGARMAQINQPMKQLWNHL